MVCKLILSTPYPDRVANLAAYQCINGDISSKLSRFIYGTHDNPDFYNPLRHALKSKHYSVVEHASFTFWIGGVSRVTLAQLSRHRIASYSVSSQRYTNIKDTDIVIPETIKRSSLYDEVQDHLENTKDLYEKLVDNGVPKEDARYICPEGTETYILVTMNARELLHFFEMRCCNRAQLEIQVLADKMLDDCKLIAPIIFENAGPSCVSEGVCHESRSCGHPRINS